jgi:transformer-2 protein
MMDPHTRKLRAHLADARLYAEESRGFGFVKMDTPEDAATCVEQLNGTPVDGKTITVAFAKRGRARTPTPGQYHGYKLDDRRPPYGGGGGYGGGGYRGGGGYGKLILSTQRSS